MAQVVESAPNGVALTSMDGRIVLVNAEFERMFGQPRAALCGSPIENLLPERFRARHVKLRAEGAQDFKPLVMGAGRELYGLRATAVEFPIEIGVSALQSPDGPWVVETVVDISVRKRLERMFQRVVEAAPCAILMIDAQGAIVLINPQAESMFGYPRSELIGRPLEMLLPERLRTVHVTLRQSFAASPAIRQMGVDRDLTARRKDGSEFPVEIGLNPVPAEDGALVLATVTDITRRNALHLELRQANTNLEEFTYAASHDLKSPLRGIADLVTWIDEDLAGAASAEVHHNLRRVADRVERLGRVIDDLLAYAHAGATTAEALPVNLPELIEGIVELLPRPPGFEIELDVAAQQLVTSKAPLESVLRNLIGNAVKHHDRPIGHIAIRAKDAGRHCLLTITDDGPGIPQSCHERVFRMFQTLKGGRSEHSGIGLALSKRMVEAHGGSITVESIDGVRGTTFRVLWPRFPWRTSDAGSPTV